MKEEIISFRTAKSAKEKGFDIKTQSYYKEETQKLHNHIRRNGYHKGKYYELSNSNMKVSGSFYRYSAPTQSLLQKWLREKYNIDIEVRTSVFQDKYYVLLLKDKLPVAKNKKEYYGTYEEALEEALQMGLDLII